MKSFLFITSLVLPILTHAAQTSQLESARHVITKKAKKKSTKVSKKKQIKPTKKKKSTTQPSDTTATRLTPPAPTPTPTKKKVTKKTSKKKVISKTKKKALVPPQEAEEERQEREEQEAEATRRQQEEAVKRQRQLQEERAQLAQLQAQAEQEKRARERQQQTLPQPPAPQPARISPIEHLVSVGIPREFLIEPTPEAVEDFWQQHGKCLLAAASEDQEKINKDCAEFKEVAKTLNASPGSLSSLSSEQKRFFRRLNDTMYRKTPDTFYKAMQKELMIPGTSVDQQFFKAIAEKMITDRSISVQQAIESLGREGWRPRPAQPIAPAQPQPMPTSATGHSTAHHALVGVGGEPAAAPAQPASLEVPRGLENLAKAGVAVEYLINPSADAQRAAQSAYDELFPPTTTILEQQPIKYQFFNYSFPDIFYRFLRDTNYLSDFRSPLTSEDRKKIRAAFNEFGTPSRPASGYYNMYEYYFMDSQMDRNYNEIGLYGFETYLKERNDFIGAQFFKAVGQSMRESGQSLSVQHTIEKLARIGWEPKS